MPLCTGILLLLVIRMIDDDGDSSLCEGRLDTWLEAMDTDVRSLLEGMLKATLLCLDADDAILRFLIFPTDPSVINGVLGFIWSTLLEL